MIEETTFKKLRHALLELMKGYPEYVYYGKFESYLTKTGERSVDLLIDHKIIEELPQKEVKKVARSEEEKKYRWYRLKPRGVDLAISMINLEHSEKVLKYSQETHYFTKVLIWFTEILALFTLGLFIFGFFQIIIILWF